MGKWCLGERLAGRRALPLDGLMVTSLLMMAHVRKWARCLDLLDKELISLLDG
jgi:hypothetical protein